VTTQYPPGYSSSEEEYRAAGEREIAALYVRDYDIYRVVFCEVCDNVYIDSEFTETQCLKCGTWTKAASS
jgi:hypothetical protein